MTLDRDKPPASSAEKFRYWHLQFVTWAPVVGYAALPVASLSHFIPAEQGMAEFIGLIGGQLMAYAHYRVLWEHPKRK